MAETNFTIKQGTLTVTEYGNAIKGLVALFFALMDNLCSKVVRFPVAVGA